MTWEERSQIIEAVAAGLRNMLHKPDAFVYKDNEGEHYWDETSILNIPILRGYFPPDTGGIDCPFVPVWNEDLEDQAAVELSLFRRGYENYI